MTRRPDFHIDETTVTGIGAGWSEYDRAALSRRGRNILIYPMNIYRKRHILVTRSDAFDRFGTRLEHRFTPSELQRMMRPVGLDEIPFSEKRPNWLACGLRAR